jgi:hypothetical protein
MRTKSILSLLTLINRISALTKLFSARKALKIVSNLLIMTAVAITFGLNEARAGFPAPPGLPGSPNVNVRINGYLPAPPGIHVLIDGGRPYYVERDHRVYMERERPARHYKKKKKHHEDNGYKYGHYNQERHGRDKHEGHGR